jgi:hypothetical protein
MSPFHNTGYLNACHHYTVNIREVTLAKPVTAAFTLARLEAGQRGRARITWMYSPAHFYIQLLDAHTEAAFESLMADMQSEFQSGPYEARSWGRGTPVAAQFKDNCWYRAQVGQQLGPRHTCCGTDQG